MPSGRRRFHFPSRDEPVDVTAPIHKSVGVTLVVAQGRDKPYPYNLRIDSKIGRVQ